MDRAGRHRTAAFEQTGSEDDLEVMTGELRAALSAGAVGFTTSCSESHATADDRRVASRVAGWDEAEARVGVVGHESTGVFPLAHPHTGIAEAIERHYQNPSGTDSVDRRAGSLRLLSVTAGARLINETVAKGAEMFGLTRCRPMYRTQRSGPASHSTSCPSGERSARSPENDNANSA
jgi:N-acyl-D-amino-acid deacylase